MIRNHRQTRIRGVAVLILALVGLFTTRRASGIEATMANYVCFPWDECPTPQEGDTACQQVWGSCSWMELGTCQTDACGPGIMRIEC